MGNIDLDARRQARLEGVGERSFTFKGEQFALPAELPYEVLGPIGALMEDERNLLALRLVMEAILGTEEHERFAALKPSIADLNALVGDMFAEYGLGGGATGAGDPDQNGSGGDRELSGKSGPS